MTAARPPGLPPAPAADAAADAAAIASAWRTALALVLAVAALRLVWLAVAPLPLYADEAQYWVWAQEPGLGYFTKPPLVAWIIAGTTAVCGDGEGCVRLASPLLHALTALLLFAVGARLYGPRAGLWAALLWTTLPAVWLSAAIISTDVPVLAAWAFGLLALLRLIDGAAAAPDGRAPLVWWLALGAAIGAGMLAKYAMAAFLPGLALFLLVHPPARAILRGPGWLAGLAALLLVLSPNLGWNLAHGFATVRHVGQNANLAGPLLHPERGLEFLLSQAAVFGPLLFAALLWLLAVRPRRTLADPRALLLASFVAPLGLVILVQSVLSRANANWAAPVYVSATVLVAGVLLEQGRRRLLSASVALHAGLAALGLFYVGAGFALAERLGHPVPRRLDPVRLVRGVDVLGREVARALAGMPDAALLAERRREMAYLMYYVRPYPASARMWNGDGVTRNHFEISREIAPGPGPWLFVTHREDAPDITGRFAGAARIGRIRIVTHPDAALTYTLWRLEGFRGYQR